MPPEFFAGSQIAVYEFQDPDQLLHVLARVIRLCGRQLVIRTAPNDIEIIMQTMVQKVESDLEELSVAVKVVGNSEYGRLRLDGGGVDIELNAVSSLPFLAYVSIQLSITPDGS